MRIGEVHLGQRVVALLDSPDVGTVERINDHDGIVHVRFPVPGGGGRSDVMDYDPADLTAIAVEKHA